MTSPTHVGLTCNQGACCQIGPVVYFLCAPYDARLGFFSDIGVATQRLGHSYH
jgi:hypothetical protein